MNKYFVDFRPDHRRVLQYIDVSVSHAPGVSIEPRYQLCLRLNLTGHVNIIHSDNGQYNQIATSLDLALLNTICELTFELENTGRQIRMELRPTDSWRLYVGGNSVFSAPIDAIAGERINSWRRGETILIKWNIRGHASVIDSASYIPIVWVDESNITDNRNTLPSLNSQRFNDTILSPMNLSNAFIQEFPLELPATIKSSSAFPSGIAGIMNDLYTLVEHLKIAVDDLRNARSGPDYRHVMDEVKSSLGTIRRYQNKKDLGKELLVETSIIGNIDPPAGDNAALDVITNFLDILENVYQIASKPAHTTLRGKTPSRFSMNPDRTEAIFVLTTTLAASKFLIERIETYVKTVS